MLPDLLWRRRRTHWLRRSVGGLLQLFPGRIRGLLRFFHRVLSRVLRFFAKLLELRLRFLKLFVGSFLCLFRFLFYSLLRFLRLLFDVVGRLFVAARHRQSEQSRERHGNRSNSFHSGNCWFLITRIPVVGLVKTFRVFV